MSYSDVGSLDDCGYGTIYRTWTATDCAGNFATCLQTITVRDNVPPSISCPADATVECDQSTDPSATGFATATDNCDNEVEVAYSDEIAAGDCPQESVITRTWTAKDCVGNTSTCVQTIKVVDTTPPELTCPGDLEVCERPAAYASFAEFETAGGSADDNCGVNTSSFKLLSETCSDLPDVLTEPAVYTRVYYIEDECGNSTTCTQKITLDCSKINLDKLTFVRDLPADDKYDWHFALYAGPEGFDTDGIENTPLIEFSTGSDGIINLFDSYALNIHETYTVCEKGIPAGWGNTWQLDTDGDGILDDYVMTYNPNADDDPPEDLGNRCFDIGAGAGAFPLPASDCDLYVNTLLFEVVNSYPGGDPRTPGYWKNWNTCTGGGQAETAALNGGPEAGWFILDDILTYPGIEWCSFTLGREDCVIAQQILDNRDISLAANNHASDPVYNLAKHLLAYQLNQAAGARICDVMIDIEMQAEGFLCEIGFDGTGDYLNQARTKEDKDAASYALELGNYLDQYNNGRTCEELAALIGVPPDPVPISDLICTTDPKDPTEFKGTDGYAVVSAELGTPPYTICMEGGDCISGILEGELVTFDNLSAGTYTFNVEDADRNTCSCTALLSQPKKSKSAEIENPDLEASNLKVYPNPFTDKVTFEFVSGVDAYGVLELYNITGQRVARILDRPVEAGVLNTIDYEPENKISGVYIYRLDLDGDIQIGRVIYKE